MPVSHRTVYTFMSCTLITTSAAKAIEEPSLKNDISNPPTWFRTLQAGPKWGKSHAARRFVCQKWEFDFRTLSFKAFCSLQKKSRLVLQFGQPVKGEHMNEFPDYKIYVDANVLIEGLQYLFGDHGKCLGKNYSLNIYMSHVVPNTLASRHVGMARLQEPNRTEQVLSMFHKWHISTSFTWNKPWTYFVYALYIFCTFHEQNIYKIYFIYLWNISFMKYTSMNILTSYEIYFSQRTSVL